PPPEMRTLPSTPGALSRIVTAAAGSASWQVMAAKKPAAPPPTMTTRLLAVVGADTPARLACTPQRSAVRCRSCRCSAVAQLQLDVLRVVAETFTEEVDAADVERVRFDRYPYGDAARA